jgi:hypothetical protein
MQIIKLKNGKRYYGYVKEDRGSTLVVEAYASNQIGRRNVFSQRKISTKNIFSIDCEYCD